MKGNSQDHEPNEPKQTTPKGLEIPVPKREDVLDALGKVVKPTEKPKP